MLVKILSGIMFINGNGGGSELIKTLNFG